MSTKKKRTTNHKNHSKEDPGDKTPPLIPTINKDGSVSIQVSQETMDKIMNKQKVTINDTDFHNVVIYVGKKSDEEIKKFMSTLKPGMPTFQSASKMDVKIEDLKFENGRLRTRLEMWTDHVEFEGNLYLIMVDPLNRVVSMLKDEEEVKEKVHDL